MGQDVWFIMADRLCSGSPKNYAAESACRKDVAQADVAVMSESGSGSRRSLTVVTTEDEALCQASTVEATAFQSVEMAMESSERPEFDSRREMSPRLPLHSPRQLPFVRPGHGQISSSQMPDSNPLVPNIVVECLTTRDAHGHRLTPPFVLPASSLHWSLLSPVASSRQIRALSDSSVHELERSPILHSSYIPSVSSESHHLLPSPWISLTDVGEKGEGRHAFTEITAEGTDLRTTPSLLRNLRKSKTCRLSAVIEPEQDDAEPYKHRQTDLPTVPFHWHFHSHKTRFSQGKSPKTYWMRRHSDSNLTNRQFPGLRPEPYPVRSSSTGDSVPSSSVKPESSEAVDKKEVLSSEKEETGTSLPTLTKRQPFEEKSPGLYEKRLKLKKYLQTRYQTSLLEMRQSGDADDVFTDRTLDPGSPGLLVSPASEIRVNISEISPTSDHSHMGHRMVPHMSDLDMPEKIFCYERQTPGREVLSKEEYSCEGVRHLETSGHMVVSEKGTEEGGGSPPAAVTTCSSEMPMFVFPVISTFGSDPVVSPSWWRHHAAQGHISSGGLVPQSEVLEPALTAWARSEGYKQKNTVTADSPRHSGGDAHCYPKLASRHGAYSHFPLLVDLPGENPPGRVGYVRCSPWESSDHRTPTSALTRPQSYSSLLTYSPVAEPPSYPLTRFPSSPALSDCPTTSSSLISSWREPRDTSPRLVSSPSATRTLGSSSDQSHVVLRHSYSPLCESGPERNESASAKSQLTCPLCSQEFMSYNHLTNHMSSHLSPPEGALKESPAAAATVEGLKVHLCKVCNRSFSRSDMLTRHTRLHTGLRPYECHLCGQVFSRSDHLHTHLRTHTGEKPYKCANCPYAAPRRDMVTRHMRIHTRDDVPHRSRRSASVCSDVLASPVYADSSGLSSEEVCRRIQSLSSVESVSAAAASAAAERSLSLSHDSSTSASMDAATDDGELGLVSGILTCRTCSLTSSESTEASDFSHAFPTCKTWSSTSAESFESFSSPRMREHLSWSSSTESPDPVFCRAPQQFFWSVRAAAGHRSERGQRDSSSSAVETLSMEMQTSFERCSVTTPERDSQEVTGEIKPSEKYGGKKVKLEEKESTFDKGKDF